jgi:hypothetical protein
MGIIPVEDDTFIVECPGCDAKYEIKEEWADREMTCEDCDGDRSVFS